LTPVLLPALTLGHHVRDRALTPREAAAALDDHRALDVERHDHEALLDRVWAPRDNQAAYDAVYVALAETLGTTVLSRCRKLARAPEVDARHAMPGRRWVAGLRSEPGKTDGHASADRCAGLEAARFAHPQHRMRLVSRPPPTEVRAVEIEFGRALISVDGQAGQASSPAVEVNARR